MWRKGAGAGNGFDPVESLEQVVLGRALEVQLLVRLSVSEATGRQDKQTNLQSLDLSFNARIVGRVLLCQGIFLPSAQLLSLDSTGDLQVAHEGCLAGLNLLLEGIVGAVLGWFSPPFRHCKS